MKDYIGREIKEGDIVFYQNSGRYSETALIKITRLTLKQAYGKVLKTNRSYSFFGSEVKMLDETKVLIIKDQEVLNYLMEEKLKND